MPPIDVLEIISREFGVTLSELVAGERESRIPETYSRALSMRKKLAAALAAFILVLLLIASAFSGHAIAAAVSAKRSLKSAAADIVEMTRLHAGEQDWFNTPALFSGKEISVKVYRFYDGETERFSALDSRGWQWDFERGGDGIFYVGRDKFEDIGEKIFEDTYYISAPEAPDYCGLGSEISEEHKLACENIAKSFCSEENAVVEVFAMYKYPFDRSSGDEFPILIKIKSRTDGELWLHSAAYRSAGGYIVGNIQYLERLDEGAREEFERFKAASGYLWSEAFG